MFCSNCGKRLKEGNRFCSECGKEIIVKAVQAEAAIAAEAAAEPEVAAAAAVPSDIQPSQAAEAEVAIAAEATAEAVTETVAETAAEDQLYSNSADYPAPEQKPRFSTAYAAPPGAGPTVVYNPAYGSENISPKIAGMKKVLGGGMMLAALILVTAGMMLGLVTGGFNVVGVIALVGGWITYFAARKSGPLAGGGLSTVKAAAIVDIVGTALICVIMLFLVVVGIIAGFAEVATQYSYQSDGQANFLAVVMIVVMAVVVVVVLGILLFLSITRYGLASSIKKASQNMAYKLKWANLTAVLLFIAGGAGAMSGLVNMVAAEATANSNWSVMYNMMQRLPYDVREELYPLVKAAMERASSPELLAIAGAGTLVLSVGLILIGAVVLNLKKEAEKF